MGPGKTLMMLAKDGLKNIFRIHITGFVEKVVELRLVLFVYKKEHPRQTFILRCDSYLK